MIQYNSYILNDKLVLDMERGTSPDTTTRTHDNKSTYSKVTYRYTILSMAKKGDNDVTACSKQK